MPRNQQEYPVLRLPEKMAANYGNLNQTDKWVATPLFGVLSMAMLVFFGPLAWVTSIAIIAVLMYRLTYGRIIYLVIDALITEPWSRWVRGDTVWQPTGKRRRLSRNNPVIDLEVGTLGPIGLLHNRAAGTDAIIVTGTGSNIAEQNVPVMHQMHLQMAEAVKRIALLPGYRIGVSWVFRSRQADLTSTWEMYDHILHPDVPWSSEDADSPPSGKSEARQLSNLARLVNELVDLEAATDSEVTMASVWTIQREGEVAAAARGKKPASLKLERLTVSQVAQAVADNLSQSGITDVRILDTGGVENYLRTAWDATGLYDWYAWRDLCDDDQAEFNDDERPSHWPQKEIKRGWNYCQLDGTYHTVFIVTGTPRESWAHFYHQLHNLPAPSLSVTIAGEAVKGDREGRVLDVAIPLRESFFELLGIRMNPKRRERMEALAERESRLHSSRFSHRYHLLIGVAADSLWKLEDHAAAVDRELRVLGFTAQRVTGRSRQLPAMWSATTGSTML